MKSASGTLRYDPRHALTKMMSATSAVPGLALVVEDEWFIRMEIADALAEEGWTVREFGDGEALADFLAQHVHFDLVVTDIRLPGRISGWDVADQCRAFSPAVGVIYCSANPIDEVRCVNGSVFFSKPCEMKQLLDAADRLGRRPASISPT